MPVPSHPARSPIRKGRSDRNLTGYTAIEIVGDTARAHTRWVWRACYLQHTEGRTRKDDRNAADMEMRTGLLSLLSPRYRA